MTILVMVVNLIASSAYIADSPSARFVVGHSAKKVVRVFSSNHNKKYKFVGPRLTQGVQN